MITFPRHLLAGLVAAARAEPDHEICGLLLGIRDAAGATVTAGMPSPNVSSTPDRAFEIAPALLLGTLRAERAGGPALLGHYHSHPRGRATPSPRDAAAAAADGRLWLILGAGGGVGLWRSVAAGAVHGRFDPVAWTADGDDGPHDRPPPFGYGTIHDG